MVLPLDIFAMVIVASSDMSYYEGQSLEQISTLHDSKLVHGKIRHRDHT